MGELFCELVAARRQPRQASRGIKHSAFPLKNVGRGATCLLRQFFIRIYVAKVGFSGGKLCISQMATWHCDRVLIPWFEFLSFHVLKCGVIVAAVWNYLPHYVTSPITPTFKSSLHYYLSGMFKYFYGHLTCSRFKHGVANQVSLWMLPPLHFVQKPQRHYLWLMSQPCD